MDDVIVPREREDFEEDVLVPEIVEPECSSVAGWPEDEFAQWVSAHRDETLGAVCDHTEQFGYMSFCDLGDPDEVLLAQNTSAE